MLMRPARYVFAAAFAALCAACAISTQEELAIGAQYAAQLNAQLPVVHDPAIQSDLDSIAARLTPLSRRPEVTYRFFLVNLDMVNAFAVPGGYIYVTRGIVERMTSMDQLAGVLGHEIGHVERRHSAQQIGRQQMAELGVGLTAVLVGDQGTAGELATQGATLAAQGILAKYSRDQERESDREAIRMTTLAGINPDGIVDFFRTLQGVEGSRPDAIEAFFASHPMTDDRITEVTGIIAADTAASRVVRTGARDDLAFQRLRERVRRLPPPKDRRAPGAK
jgi:predicted Zn-dependent protease